METEGMLEAVTESKAKEFHFKWTIEDFSLVFDQVGTTHSSPDFQFKFNGDSVKTRISLFEQSNLYARFQFIELKDSVIMKWGLILYNSRFEKLIVPAQISPKSLIKQGYVTDWKYLIPWKDLLKGISHDDKLILNCNVKISTPNFQPVIMSGPLLAIPCSSKVNDFGKFRMNGDFSDMAISVRGKEFRVHKIILAAQSPVFATMFKHEMKETKSGKVEIDDIEPEVFEEFLDFIYSGKAKVDDYAWELLPVADKYDVQDLKAICEVKLIKNITKENCLKTLVHGDLHSAKKLKEVAMNFIVKNAVDIDQNELVQLEDKSLILELMKMFMNRE